MITRDLVEQAKRADVLALVPGLRHWAQTNGGEYHGPCPRCEGIDRFLAWPQHPKGPRASCRQCHESPMDPIALVQWLGRAHTFAEAIAYLVGPTARVAPSRPPSAQGPRPYCPTRPGQQVVDRYPYYTPAASWPGVTGRSGERVAPVPASAAPPRLMYIKERREPGPSGKRKTFYQMHPRPGIAAPDPHCPEHWFGGRGAPAELWPYNWPAAIALPANEPLLWVDGEKDVHTARAAGLTAVCGPDGGASWQEPWGALFVGHPAWIIPDNDPGGQGMQQAQQAAAMIAPYASGVRIVRVPQGHDLTAWAETLVQGQGGAMPTPSDLAAQVRAEAEASPDYSAPAAEAATQPAAPRFRVLTDAESDRLPPPEWLVDRLILKGAVNLLYGPGGHGKSLISVDLALSLGADQTTWYGRAALPGPVVYIAAEAPDEVAQRKRAWKHERAITHTPNFFLIPERVPLLDPQAVPDLLASLPPAAARPVLVVIDTLSRTMRGGDENSGQDVGRVVEAAEKIRDATGAAILIVHHSGKRAEAGARGFSGLTYDARQAIAVTMEAGIITLRVEKHNNSAAQDPLRFVIRAVPDGTPDGTPVLLPAAAHRHSIATAPLDPRDWAILQAIGSPACRDGARNRELRARTDLQTTQITRQIDGLIERGLVRVLGQSGHRDRRYFLTDTGTARLAAHNGYTVTEGNNPVTGDDCNPG